MAAREKKSKKASDASSRSESPPSDITYYLDKCLGNHDVRNALVGEGAIVEVHTDHFPPDAEDRCWLPEVGKRGWVVLTKDRHILVNQLEVLALLESGTATFVLKAADMTGAEMACAFVTAHRHMVRMATKKDRPFIASVTRQGRVSYIVGYDGLSKKIQS